MVIYHTANALYDFIAFQTFYIPCLQAISLVDTLEHVMAYQSESSQKKRSFFNISAS